MLRTAQYFQKQHFLNLTFTSRYAKDLLASKKLKKDNVICFFDKLWEKIGTISYDSKLPIL